MRSLLTTPLVHGGQLLWLDALVVVLFQRCVRYIQQEDAERVPFPLAAFLGAGATERFWACLHTPPV
jgi:hypothetical protein